MMEHVQSALTAAGDAVSADWARIVWAWGAAEFSVAWVFGAIGGLVGFFYAVLSHDGNYAVIRDLCRRDSPRRLWRRIVLIGLRRLSRWFGPSWSFKAFDRSLALALIYPLIVILFAWALGGPFRLGLGRMDTGFEDTPTALRWSAAISVPVFLIVQVYWLRLMTYFESRVLTKVDNWATGLNRTKRDQFTVAVVRFFILIVGAGARSAVVAFVVYVAFAPAASVAGGMAISFVVGVAVVTALVVNAVGAVVAVVAVVVVGAAIAGVTGGAIDSMLNALALTLPLYLVVPVLNAGFDFLSWFASRRLFLRLARRSPSTARLIVRATLHLTLDVILAMVFLGCLAVVLPACMALYSHTLLALGAEAGFPWRDYLNAATDDPWGSGLAVTAMLITTLVPTLLHMAAVGFSLALPTIGHFWPGERATPNPVDRLRYALLTTASIVASLMLLIAVAVVIHAFIAGIFGGFGTTLAVIAEVSGAWVETWFAQAL